MLKRPISVLFVLLSLTAFSSPRVEAVPVISVGPYTASTTIPFLVPIVITGAVELISWQFDLAFDPNDLQINFPANLDPVTEGPFFLSVAQFPPLFIPGFIVNDQGLLLGVAGAWQDPPPGPSGNGILAYVEFVAKTGDSTIRVDNVLISSSFIPEPTALLLMATGLIVLSAGRISRRRRGSE